MSVDAIAAAASVLLVRGTEALEVYVVKRAQQLRFFGGFLAFPGGKVGVADAEVVVEPAAGRAGTIDEEPARLVAAVREVFEETGVLLARRGQAVPPVEPAELEERRRDLTAGRVSFGALCADLGVSVRAGELVPLGRLVTPAFAARRFDTSFFLARPPAGQEPQVWPGELEEGFWTTAEALWQGWNRGECLIAPPTVLIVNELRGRSYAEAAERLPALFQSAAGGTIHPIFFAPDVQMIPLRTLSLPPSTHTNAYLVGRERVYLIDPGTSHADEQERLFAAVDQQQACGRRLSAVVLTHHHPDHVGAAAVCAERYQVPIRAHSWTARKLQGRIAVARTIEAGERLPLGKAADGFADWALEAVHTPGHAPGHLAFYDSHYRLLWAGDMVSTLSSVVIAPPDGDLAEYLRSLRRLREYPARLLLPAHGNPTARYLATMDECLAHRLKREEMLLAALDGQPRRIDDLAVELYKGVPEGLMRFARLQVQAGLTKLQAEGRAEHIDAGGETLWTARAGWDRGKEGNG
jgi:glyoxylase-like metal-dependent hydrolase (beta-lactamase superfamily II)/8-oxo-dGTP pyrophosphatase MutT (NUDIX family)